MPFFKRSFQDNPLESTTPAQCHVRLTRRKERSPKVNDDAIIGLPLTLMDRNCPGQFKRELFKKAFLPRQYFPLCPQKSQSLRQKRPCLWSHSPKARKGRLRET